MGSKVLEKIQKAKADLREMMEKQGEAALKEAFVNFFKANPKITAVAWSQYAPHFNDGVSVHSFCLSLKKDPQLNDFNGYGGGDDDEDGGATFLGEYAGLPAELEDVLGNLESEVKDDELFEMIWGNGYKVMATPDGKFEAEDFDHD